MLKRFFRRSSYFFSGIIGLVLVIHYFFEAPVAQVIPDQKLYRLLAMQRQLDRYIPLGDALLQGTHNSYNSDAYHTLLSYYDRQQRLSVGEQLENGARFIELDTHYTFNARSFQKDFLLCHGSSKFNFLPVHWGCSPFDLPLEVALQEIQHWLERDENSNEILLFYIEDHSEGEHEALYGLLKKYGIIDRIFPSGSCRKIPDSISKQDMLDEGKNIIFWKDHLRKGFEEQECSDLTEIRQLAFNRLGVMDRHAEDRTFLGSIAKRIEKGVLPRIEAEDIREKLGEGANIINFDNFSVNDERLYELLWSWDLSISLEDLDEESCAIFQENGSWQLAGCKQGNRKAACFDQKTESWLISNNKGKFDQASSLCPLGSSFSAPANYLENQNLTTSYKKHLEEVSKNLSLEASETLWLNVRYVNRDGASDAVELGDKRKHNSGKI